MSQSTSAPVLLEIEGNIAWVILNRPEKKNALDGAMWRALARCLADAAKNPSVHVLILTGAGDAFAAGADISEFSSAYASEESAISYQADVAAANDALANFPAPTLALIRGSCVGGGCGLALCCDVRYADTTARLGITPSKLGLCYPWGDMKRLFDAVGGAAAKDLLFSGRLVRPDEARHLGLIHHIHAPDEIKAVVMAYAALLCANSGTAIRATKKMLHAMRDGAVEPTPDLTKLALEVALSPDFKEGYTAFVEKRKPDFR